MLESRSWIRRFLYRTRKSPSCGTRFSAISSSLITLMREMMVLCHFLDRGGHTRYIGDWSSDVCSSDLSPLQKTVDAMQVRWAHNLKLKDVEVIWDKRSEERRVGKECRSRWSRDP